MNLTAREYFTSKHFITCVLGILFIILGGIGGLFAYIFPAIGGYMLGGLAIKAHLYDKSMK